MNSKHNNFTVNSTWIVNEECISIEDVISVEDFNDSEWSQWTEAEIGDIINLTSEDTFPPVELIRRNQNESCSLIINLEDPCVKITKIILISEAKIIEIYGKHGEYICTEKSHLLGCLGGKKFYIADPAINGTREMTLKFPECGDNLWLYGITLLIIRQDYPTSTSIDFTNVDQILQNSNIHLTEKAERAKEFIKKYNIKKENEQNDGEMFHTLLEKWVALGGNNSSKITTFVSNNRNNDTLVTMENGNKNYDNDLKQYVDKKLEILEERVQNKLEKQFKEFEQKQNEKLDNIIQLLIKKN